MTLVEPNGVPRGTRTPTARSVAWCSASTLTASAWASSEPVRLQVSPTSVAAGDRVTLSGSVGPESAGLECPGGVQLLSRAFGSTQQFAEVPLVVASVRPNGTFTTTTTTTTTLIPRSRAAGTYSITGRCGGANFAGAILVVRAAPTSPTTTPEPMSPTPTSPPADPPVTQPQVPAPMVAGPATQPTSDLASRWVIPGLAALGSGILAALSVWLLDRRRHPARQNRQGRCYLAQ
jgi:hypothetical protein